VRPLSIPGVFFFPEGHAIAAYVFFLAFPFYPSICGSNSELRVITDKNIDKPFKYVLFDADKGPFSIFCS
jgi:hypothetical protein